MNRAGEVTMDAVEVAARAIHAALRRRGDSPDMAAFDRLLPSAQAEYRVEARAVVEALGAYGFMRGA